MKKLLLSVILLASSFVKADVLLEAILKEGDKATVVQIGTLSNSTTQLSFSLNDRSFKIVTTKIVKNEADALEFAFDLFEVIDGNETLIAQPQLTISHSQNAILTIGSDSESFTFVMSEVEASAQEEVQIND